jgi:hypothetical protein
MYVCVKIEFLNFEILHTDQLGFLSVCPSPFLFWMIEAWTLETAAALFLPFLRLEMA